MQGLITLLARFPSFPARKVRRLAKQLDLLDGFAAPEVDGIKDDLMEYNLMVAERQETSSDLAEAHSDQTRSPDFKVVPLPSEKVMMRVVPLEQVIKIIEKAYPVEFTTQVISELNDASFMTTEKIDDRHDTTS